MFILIQQLAAAALDPPLHDRIHAGHLDTAEHDSAAGVGEDRIEQRRVLAVAVADEEATGDLTALSDRQLTRLRGDRLGFVFQSFNLLPLAEQDRRHIHARTDMAELAVRHETRRTGSPYTLVLTKTVALFERERRARDESDLAWLRRQTAVKPGKRGRTS